MATILQVGMADKTFENTKTEKGNHSRIAEVYSCLQMMDEKFNEQNFVSLDKS